MSDERIIPAEELDEIKRKAAKINLGNGTGVLVRDYLSRESRARMAEEMVRDDFPRLLGHIAAQGAVIQGLDRWLGEEIVACDAPDDFLHGKRVGLKQARRKLHALASPAARTKEAVIAGPLAATRGKYVVEAREDGRLDVRKYHWAWYEEPVATFASLEKAREDRDARNAALASPAAREGDKP